MIAALLLAAVLSFLHFFSEEYGEKIERFHGSLVSFSAGLFIAVIFLELLPEFFHGVEFVGEIAFILLLSGFVLFHISEKYVYQHITNKRVLLKDLSEIHVVGFFVDHFTVGVALFVALDSGYYFGALIFVPLLLHTVSSSLSLSHIDEIYRRKSIFGLILPLSPVFGVLFAFALNPAPLLYFMLFSFVVGSLLYIVIRDMIPSGRKGNLPAFGIGMLIMLVVFLLRGIL